LQIVAEINIVCLETVSILTRLAHLVVETDLLVREREINHNASASSAEVKIGVCDSVG
jgi:hypothetical protein